MAISILDHSVSGQTGLSYAPPTGTNRLVIMCVSLESTTTCVLNNITWNSIVRTPSFSDPLGTGILANYVCIFEESDILPTTSQPVTLNFSAAPGTGDAIFIYTISGAKQTINIQASATSLNSGGLLPPQSISMTNTGSGWLSIGLAAFRTNISSLGTVSNTWGNSDFASINFSSGGGFGLAASHVSTGGSDTFGVSWTSNTTASDLALDLIGFAPASTGAILGYTAA